VLNQQTDPVLDQEFKLKDERFKPNQTFDED
jgi:hypothetical protein